MTHPDKVQLLDDACGNLTSAMAHLVFSMERTRELVPRIRDELSLEELERLESLASRFARLAARPQLALWAAIHTSVAAP